VPITLRADPLGTYGYQRDTSPCLDQLTKDSYLFEKCMADFSWTIPSRSSSFTGLPLFTHPPLEHFLFDLVNDWKEQKPLF
jgi:arylsulfatase